ncbi:MAG: PAS-domain containing protein [Rhodospirillaceae bacterium]|nr:PAS-domain containing protein [Rhodospirillaceae bacterium]
MSPIVRATAPLATDSLRAALSTFLAAFVGFVIFSALTKPAASTGEWIGLAALLAAGLSAFAGFVRRPDAERRVLSAVLDNMIEAIAVHDRESRLVAWNRRYAELFKLPNSLLATHPSMFEIVRHQIRSGEHPNVPGETEDEKVKARMKQVPPPNKSFTFERKRPDQTWIEVRGIPLPGGGFVRTYVDTTDRKRAEEAQAEQLELLDQIMRNIDQGIVVIDAEDRMVGFNQRYSELLDLPEEYLRTKPSLQQTSKLLADRGEFQGQPTPVDSPADWQAMLAQPVTHGLPKVYRRRRPNGTVLEFRNTALPGGGSVRTITDVTERVRSEEAIRASEKMLHAVIDAIPIMVNLKDRDRRYLMVNRATTELVGVEAKELLGRTSWPGREAENVSLTANRDVVAITTGEPQVYREQAGTDEDGRPRHWVTSKTPIKDDDGNVTHVVTASYDITDLVRADESVRASERQLSAILDAIPISVVLKDRDRRYLMMNRATERMFGVNAKDIIGQSVWPGRTAEQSEQAAERDLQAIATGHQMVYEENFTGKDRDGRPIYWMTAKTAIKDDTGKITHIVSTSYDVTEQRRAAEAVRESEQLLQAVIDAVPVTISVKDRGLRYRMINNYMADLFGFEVTDVIGMTGWDNQAGEHSARSQTRDREVLATGQTVGFYEETLIDAQGRRREWLTTKVPIIGDLGEVSYIVTAGYEVSDLKRAEREVREREQQIRSLLESSPIGVTMTRRDGSLKFWNARYLEYINRLTTKPIEKIDVRDFYRNPGDREAVIAELKLNGKVRDIEIECVDMQGSPLWVSSSLDQIEFEGERVTLGWFYEVTELKEAEKRLRESEHRLRTILESSPIAVSISTEAGRSVFRNQSIFDLYGYSSGETLGGSTSDFYLYPSDRARLIDELHRTGKVSGAEVPLKRRDGSIFWVLVFWQPLQVDGEPGIVAWLVDQTDRRRAADELSSKTAVLEAVLENMDQGITMYDSDLRVVAWNRKFSELIDLPPEFLASNPSHADIIRRSGPAEVGVEGEALDRLANEHAARLRATTQPRISVRRRPNGMMLETRTTPVAGGGFVRTYTDVTEIKAAERKVAESELRLRTILESSPVGVSISRFEGERIFINQAFADLYRLSQEEMFGANAAEFYVDDAVRTELVARLRREGRITGAEILQRRRDGTAFWAYSFWQRLEIGGEDTLVAWTYDLTDQKRQAEELANKTSVLEAVLNNMDQGITMYDADLRLVAWNRRYSELAGIPEELLVGRPSHADLVRYLGPTEAGVDGEDLEELARIRTAKILATTAPRVSMRRKPNGMMLETRTTPIASGGYVRTYTDVTEIKAAELKVAESEHRLRTILQSSPVGFAISQLDGGRVFTNRAYAELYGLTPDEVMATNALDFYVNPADRAPLIERLKRDGQVAGIELHQKRKDGTPFWCLSFWQEIEIGGEASTVVWTLDLTERKRQAEQLAHQTEILTATLENMDQGIAMFDAEHKMVAWNRLFAEGVHLPPEFFDGNKTYDDIIRHLGPTEYGLRTKEQIEGYIKRHREHIASLTSSHLNTHHRPDGEYIDIRTSPMPGGGFVRTYTNVTELKLAEQRLRDSENRLRSLLESSPLAVSLQTFSGKRLFVNEAFADLYGLSRDGSLDADPRDYYVNPEDRAGLIERMKSEDRIPGVEIEFRRHDDSRFWAYMLWQRLTIDGEDSFVTWAYDVTERRRYQDELTKTRDAAEQASRAKSSFLATMSHEIRTPMNGVLGLLELLQQSQLTSEQQEMAAVIGESASALLKIIDDILDFSKIEAGKLEVEQVPLALLTLVEGVAETLAAAARKKALAMVTFVDPNVPDLVRGDPVRLRQILFNLIGNAIKFTEKGQVTIETVPAPGLPGTVLFRIIDTGIGLTPEGRARLFQAFMQADDSTTRKFGGTGLGLSICKRLAENMGGDISVESEFGVGSTFTVTLPLPTEPAETTHRRQLDGVSVLVVEDDPTMRTVLARYLGAEGAQVEWVDSAEAALSRLRGRGAKVDVLVVDYKLPGIDGFALRQQVAESKTLSSIGMVLVTAYDDRGQRRRALEAGFKAYLTKPVRRAVLLRAVEIALGRADGDEASADEAPVDRGAPADRNLALAEGRLILVAEDNPTNQMLVRRQLERLGYAADIVVDGRQGIDAYASVPYGMVITDCHMPVMDGFELTQKIRDLEHLTGRSRVPIVALTANVLQGEAERCLAAGMDDYLGKPVRLGRLAETIQRWLPKAAATTATEAHGEELGAKALAANAPIDTAHLIEMFGEIDDVARATLATFLGSSRELVRAVIAQLATGDLASAGKSAHSIKGAARSAGAFPLAEIASGIEQAAKGVDMSEARQLSTGLAAELARVEAEVKRI